MSTTTIRNSCALLASAGTRGELGAAIAQIVLTFSPRDLQQMRWNFSASVQDIPTAYRRHLEELITAHLHGIYQNILLMNQRKIFSGMNEPLPAHAHAYWTMVSAECSGEGDGGSRLRFLKFLLTGFCMFVQGLPGHPVGMAFPGGDKVEVVEGIYYCPAREKANDVDSALCPFCPALPPAEVGYLKPPVNASRHRKQEYIDHIHQGHHFNG